MNPHRSEHAPAVDRALDVIDLMAASHGDLSFSEIRRETGIPRQSLVRILNTLRDRGIVDRSAKRGGYRLGMRLLHLGNRLQDKIQLRSVARPCMEELARKTRKTVELSTLDRDQLILIEQVEGSEGVRLYSRVGAVYPYLHAVAVGKIYLAHMDREKRRQVLEKIGLPAVTEHTLTRLADLEQDLVQVRKNGFAFEDQELRKGIRRVAAPVYDHRDELAGCVSVAATVFSFDLEDLARLGDMVRETAERISENMGKRP